MTKLKIKKGDTVKVIAGKDKGKTGVVLKAFPKESKLLIDGINQVKRHTKPSKVSQGGIVAKPMPIHVSNVSYFDKNTNKASRIGYKLLEDGSKKRFLKSSGEMVE